MKKNPILFSHAIGYAIVILGYLVIMWLSSCKVSDTYCYKNKQPFPNSKFKK